MPSPFELLTPYKILIEREIDVYFARQWSTADRLRDACRYALQTGGKRFRPAIVLMIGEALGTTFNMIAPALAVEFFHTASLIADDLPCMDDDDFRRNVPTTHRAFDEATALLASYALIAEGYSCLAKGARELAASGAAHAASSATITLAALENVSFNTGYEGATGGQYLDLFPATLDSTSIQQTLAKKTASLFEIAFVCGWLFGGGREEKLPLVQKAAYHFGMAFQIADDLSDSNSDSQANRSVNIATACGIENAKNTLSDSLREFNKVMLELELQESKLQMLADLL